jgi:hypothetical protein
MKYYTLSIVVLVTLTVVGFLLLLGLIVGVVP